MSITHYFVRASVASRAVIATSVAALSFAVLVAACGDDVDGGDDSATGTITVFAAASLTDVFAEVAQSFENEYPGTSVEINFASSSALAVQINEGAPADVFASANETQMAVVIDGGAASDAAIFATNGLTVVAPSGTSRVTSYGDLAKPGVRLVLGAPEVPVGAFARESFMRAEEIPEYGQGFSERVLANLVSNETDVRAVLVKVQLGEADAGIVYVTDVAAAEGDVDMVEVPEAANIVATYPIAALAEAPNRSGADAFVAFVLSDAGQQILGSYGFGGAP